jgi:LytS/YehU family sensor histidine kinase
MLTLYIELEELRFENKFTYTIHTDEKLNTSSIFIPGMLIQPFVENSIRHGIRFKKGDARVDINFTVSDSILICSITDNGIGRQEAAKLKNSTEEYKSMGTAIVDERIQALGILFDGKLKNYISDLTGEDGKATGTRVTVEIPFKQLSA